MNAKHSALLLSGLLLLMIAAALAQTSDTVRPTCPQITYSWNANYRPDHNATKWVRADWNANTDRWEIDCSSEMFLGNAVGPASGMSNAVNSATNAVWANAATNAAARPKKKPRP